MTYLWITLQFPSISLAEPETSENSSEKSSSEDTRAENGTQAQISETSSTSEMTEEEKTSEQEKSSSNSPQLAQPYFWGGIEMAPILSTSELSAGFLPQLEVGVQLPYVDKMFGLVFYGSYHNSKTSGKGGILEMPNSAFTYDMIQREGELGLSFRTVFPQVPVVQPEIWLGPTVQLLQSEVIGKIDTTKYPTSTEQNTRIGFHAAILGSYVLPVGEIYGGCHYTTYMWKNLIQGEARSHLISPTVGYRYLFGNG